jgi:hypothetical protein
MKKAVFYDVTYGSCKNRRFGGNMSIIRAKRISHLGTTLALTTAVANVPSSLVLSTLMIKAIRSSETSSHTRATLRHIPEVDILDIT